MDLRSSDFSRSSAGCSTSTVSSKVCTVLCVSVVTLPRMFTTPLATPSLVTNVISRFRIWIVTGTRTVLRRDLHEISAHIEWEDRSGQQLVFAHGAFQILELDRRRRKQLGGQLDAIKFLRLILASPIGPAPRFSKPPLNRSAFFAIPISSHCVRPAPGVFARASFSLRSMVKW